MFRTAHRVWARLATLAAIVLLAQACGGGGGGGGGDGGPGLRITLDRSSISFDYRDDGNPAAAQVVATAVGPVPNPLYVLATDEGGSLDPQIPATLTSSSATFTIRPKAGLAPATYTGRLLLSACTDPACNNRIGGTPLPVAYTVTVRPSLKLTPSALRIDAVGGQAAGAVIEVQLPQGVTGFSLESALPDWLRATMASGRLTLEAQPWRSGNYSTTLDVLAGGEHRYVPVVLVVNPPPGGERDLALGATSASLVTTENARSNAQAVRVDRPTWAPATAVPWRVEYASGTGWLQVTDTPQGVSLVADAATLPQGSYQATLVFEPAPPASTVRLPVSVTVGAGVLPPAPQTLTVDAESTASSLHGNWPVLGAGSSTFNWTATSNQPWLRLATASGAMGGRIDFTIDTALVAQLANFADHTATVTVTPTPATMTPVTAQLTLAKRLPEVLGVGPQLLVGGRTVTLNISGRGFGALATPAARLRVGTVTVDSVTRVNDRTLQVRLTPQVPDTPLVSVGNALGEAQPTATLRVISPQTLAYAAVPSGGNPRAIVYDAARLAVYGVNVEGETLQRFRLQNGSWVLDAVPIPQILDAGMSADGESIIVTATPGRLRLVDPATLQTTFTLDHAPGFARNLTYVSPGVVSTHDGRSWLPTGSGTWNELGYFDLRTRSVLPRPEQPNFQSTFHGGPWAAASLDGSRMVVVQSASISPAPPMLGYDPASGLLLPEASGQTFSYDMHLSTDGSRAIFDGTEVRARDGSLIGRANLDGFPGYFGIVGLMSPEGHRAYVLAMHSDTRIKPHVFVFDTRAVNPVSTSLTMVGHFELPDNPTCRTGAYECNIRARAAISPDGATLFFLGDQKLVVQPVDAALRVLAGPRSDARPSATRPQAWRR